MIEDEGRPVHSKRHIRSAVSAVAPDTRDLLLSSLRCFYERGYSHPWVRGLNTPPSPLAETISLFSLPVPPCEPARKERDRNGYPFISSLTTPFLSLFISSFSPKQTIRRIIIRIFARRWNQNCTLVKGRAKYDSANKTLKRERICSSFAWLFVIWMWNNKYLGILELWIRKLKENETRLNYLFQ